MRESPLRRDPDRGVHGDALEDQIFQQEEHPRLASLGPHSLGVAQLHLQELGGPEDGGHLVARLEQLPAGEDLGQQTAVGPEVGWSSRRWRLQRSVVVDGAVPVVPSPVLDDPLLHLERGLLQVAQSLVLPGLGLASLRRVAAQPRAALRPVRALLQHHHLHHYRNRHHHPHHPYHHYHQQRPARLDWVGVT